MKLKQPVEKYLTYEEMREIAERREKENETKNEEEKGECVGP